MAWTLHCVHVWQLCIWSRQYLAPLFLCMKWDFFFFSVETNMMRRAPGHGAPSSHAHGPPALGPGQVSNVTNSNDFISKDSRVFVGNLNTFALSKEDVDGIFRRYGIVTGISMHKGYAFVQFTHPGDARRAVAFEDGQVYAGQPLGKMLSFLLLSEILAVLRLTLYS